MSTTELRDVAELEKALSVDHHGIEPIPDGDRDSTAWQQFWIWFGANISPLQWVAGAIGPQLGLSLVQSIAIMVVGQALGALIFGFFALMGKRTGVSQFALGRMAFGRRGNNIPSITNGVITLSWIGLNTYVVLSLATYCLHELGLPNDRTVEYSVAAVIMIIQLVIGTLGFYAIRTFEKWTVPVFGAVMAVMTVLAFSKGKIVWDHSTVHGSGLIRASTALLTAVGIGWGFGWAPWASDYSRFTRREVTEKRLYWASATGTFIALIWLGVLGAAMVSSSTRSDPAELVASLFGVMTIPVLLVIIHGAVAGNIQCVYSAPLCFLAGGIKIKTLGGEHHHRRGGQRRHGRVPGVNQVRYLLHQLHELVRNLDGLVGSDRDHRLLRSQPRTSGRTRAVRVSRDVALWRHSLALARRSRSRAGLRMDVRTRQRFTVPGSDLAGHQRSGLIMAGFDPFWRTGLLVAVPIRSATCHRAFSGIWRRGNGCEDSPAMKPRFQRPAWLRQRLGCRKS